MNCLHCNSTRSKSINSENNTSITECLQCGRKTRWVGTTILSGDKTCRYCGRKINSVHQSCFTNKGMCES